MLPLKNFMKLSCDFPTSHCLSALNIPLLRGRFIADTDRGETAPVCVINKAMAQKYWPDKDPMGQLIVLTRNDVNGEKKPRRIVGVVAMCAAGSMKILRRRSMCRTHKWHSSTWNCWSTRATLLPPSAKSVAAVLQTIDPDQPIRSVHIFSNALPGRAG